jgi:hypothetical protein
MGYLLEQCRQPATDLGLSWEHLTPQQCAMRVAQLVALLVGRFVGFCAGSDGDGRGRQGWFGIPRLRQRQPVFGQDRAANAD